MRLLKSKRNRYIVLALLAFVILFSAVFGYLWILVSSLHTVNNNPTLPGPTLKGYLNNQGLLSYNNGAYELPYFTVFYNTTNALQLNGESTIYVNPVPSHLYILNYSAGCFDCGNVSVAVNALLAGIKGYDMNGLYANTSFVTAGNLNQIQNGSILVIVTGLIPSSLEANNFSVMQSLLQRRTSILYVGLNFSSNLVEGVVAEPAPSVGIPRYLQSTPVKAGRASGMFAFDSPTFRLSNGTVYNYLTYENTHNGSIVVFPNTLSSWPSEQQAGSDLAKAVWQLFWLPRYAYGTATTVTIPKSGVGNIGIVLNKTNLDYNLTLPQRLNSGYMRVVLGASPLYSGKQVTYFYIKLQPQLGSGGIVSMAPVLSPNESNVKIIFNLTNAPSKPANLSTFIKIYNQSLVATGWTAQGPTVKNFSSKSQSSFFNYYNIGLGPGGYIITLTNFSNDKELAAGYFTVPNYVVTPVVLNLSAGIFAFKVTSGGLPVTNLRYNASLNNFYTENGVVQSGIIEYKLPSGAPEGRILNFTFRMLGRSVSYIVVHTSAPVAINTQYVELGLVMVMMIIMVVFVRAPTRDEFYIDVPNLPETKKVEVKLKAAEVLSIFDKLNSNYHWKYMPLSKTEVKSAIALNMKYNNIPVELTYRNVDSILDSLLVKDYVVSADELYAPASWVESSKHDINYLATFKKLRIYFVTHSYTFTDIDISEEADMVATLHGNKRYVVIYSDTSRFKNIPIYPGFRTYLVFLNADAMEEFKGKLYNTSSDAAEKLKMYISADYIRLVDADNVGKEIE